MILVDTSVWVAALRSGEGREAVVLRSLLDRDLVGLAAPVRLEILGGASKRELGRLRRLLSALPLWRPDEATWRRMESWVETAVEADQRFGIVDLLIAAITDQNDAALWSLDRDFERMAELGFLRLHRPGADDR